jgi:glycosyltransferase involved in cell wall biosynthesis
MQKIAINVRVLNSPITGVQRYLMELRARWNGGIDSIAPYSFLSGMAGHAWEQLVLPTKLQGRVLFSPSNTGPLQVENQVVTIHDMAVFDCPKTFNPRFEAFYKFLLPRLVRRTRHIITVSEFVKGRIIAHTNVNASKVTVIPNGVASRFSPAAASGLDRVVAALNLPSREYVLVVGSLEPRKNLTRLLQAWSRVKDHVSEGIWLVVIGAKGKSRVFRDISLNSLPARVLLLGHVADHFLPTLYAGALAMAFISIYEGFGLPALEAMASGTPVLVGNRSSLPEVVGNAGMTVDPFDIESIAQRMQQILQDPKLRSDLRQLGILRAEHFSWNETARKTWDVLQSVSS